MTALVSGATSSGKTTLIVELIKRRHEAFTGLVPDKLVWAYGEMQKELFDSVRELMPNSVFVKGLEALEQELPEENAVPILVSGGSGGKYSYIHYTCMHVFFSA